MPRSCVGHCEGHCDGDCGLLGRDKLHSRLQIKQTKLQRKRKTLGWMWGYLSGKISGMLGKSLPKSVPMLPEVLHFEAVTIVTILRPLNASTLTRCNTLSLTLEKSSLPTAQKGPCQSLKRRERNVLEQLP